MNVQLDEGRLLTLVNVGQDTALCDGDVAQELVQLLIVPDSELKMAGDDAGLLVVTSSVASQLEDFGRKVLKDGSQIDGSTGTNALSVVALPQKTVDTTDRERETGLGGAAAKCVSTKSRKKHHNTQRALWQELRLDHSRLRVLGARGLAARLATASHFDCVFWGVWEEKL